MDYMTYKLLEQVAASQTAMQATLKQVQTTLNQVLAKENIMALDLTALANEVANNTTVEQSVVALINNLAQQIAAIPPSSDPATQAALNALATTLTENDKLLADKVLANTPQPANPPASGRKG